MKYLGNLLGRSFASTSGLVKTIGLLAAATALAGCAKNDSSDASAGVEPSASAPGVADTVSAPNGYFLQYGNIQHTYVTIKDFDVHTDDGAIIHVSTNSMLVDLQDLSAFSKGLNLDLTNAVFPNGAATIKVAEIRTNVVGSFQANIQSTDGSVCDLSKVPKVLMFYASAPLVLGHAAYHVKVGYTALNSIQLDLVTPDKKNCDKDNDNGDKDKNDKSDKHEASVRCQCNSGTPTPVLQCRLVNARDPIIRAPLAVDDSF